MNVRKRRRPAKGIARSGGTGNPGEGMRHNFGVFVLSHGRAEEVAFTLGTIERRGYTGPWWIVLDTGDDTIQEYEEKWGAERLLIFDKASVDVDLADNGGSDGVIVFARVVADRLAREQGLDYYCTLDDDYTFMAHRYVEDGVLEATGAYHLDRVFDACIDFLDTSGALTVAWSQGGDFIGGADNTYYYQGLSRKAMNSFIVRTGRPIPFQGRLNEDVNAYSLGGSRGALLFSLTTFYLVQIPTQQNKGGMVGAYLSTGTYRKSFYTLMLNPSCTSLASMGSVNPRIHHRVRWDRAVPKILSSRWQKSRTDDDDDDDDGTAAVDVPAAVAVAVEA